MLSRRSFLKHTGLAGCTTAGFIGLQRVVHAAPLLIDPYGPLIKDPKGIIDLPKGFSYHAFSRAGEEMDDGLFVPGRMDGMGAFAGEDGRTILVRNHELHPKLSVTSFGEKLERLDLVEKKHFYDYGKGKTPHNGGTTTLVYDTNKHECVKHHQSLFGTVRNCAGGVTPWNTWISCEETVNRPGTHAMFQYHSTVDHGYNFEVPTSGVAEPVALKAMGRFNHEAVAVHEPTGIVYQTEDRHEGLFYRFIPNEKGKLAAGGKLQALVVSEEASYDTRNWLENATRTELHEQLKVEWLDINDVEAPEDDLRFRGFKAGAARFARGEGIWAADNGDMYFTCTNGGVFKDGQIWKYTPSPNEGTADESKQPGVLELFVEPNEKSLMHAVDNLTVSPWGGLVACEDRNGKVIRLVGVTPKGELYHFANNRAGGEFAGVCFSPDASTMFVNLQIAGMTLAITGPWQKM